VIIIEFHSFKRCYNWWHII